MTVPTERTRAVMNTSDFLKDLLDPAKTPRVPKDVRIRAGWCLRHYPWMGDLKRSAQKLPDVWGPVE